jgi:hypothetical protein
MCNVGQLVEKRSGNSFKSGNKQETIIEITLNEHSGKPAARLSDDSIVDLYILKKAVEPCIRVEYDPEYSGGDYSGVGEFAYIPVKMLDVIQNENFKRKVEIVFEKTTGYFKDNIIHYSNEEFFPDEQ